MCKRVYAVVDCATERTLAGGRACYKRDCDTCGPKRSAEDMARVQLRIEGWIFEKRDGVGFVNPTLVTISQDPLRIPFEFASAGHGEWTERFDMDAEEWADYAEALRIEERWFRQRVTEFRRYVDRVETRAGRPRVDWVGCVERGPDHGTLHAHSVCDRVLDVTMLRRAAYAAGIIGPRGRGGRGVDAEYVDGGSRGAAAYLSKIAGYLSKPMNAEMRPKGARVLMHSRGCIPSIPVWRALRRKGVKWTPSLVAQYWRADQRDALLQFSGRDPESAARWRSDVEERAPAGAVVVRRDLQPDGRIKTTELRDLFGPTTPDGEECRRRRDEFRALTRLMMGDLGQINADARLRKRLASVEAAAAAAAERASRARRPLLFSADEATRSRSYLDRVAVDHGPEVFG